MIDLKSIESFYELSDIILRLKRENEILKDKVKLLEDLIQILESKGE